MDTGGTDPNSWPHGSHDSEFPADESVVTLMRRVRASIARVADDRLDSQGLTRAQMGPLFMLRTARASTTAEIARELHIDSGAMTRMLDRLENKGLCRRLRSNDDGRVVRIELTTEGRLSADRMITELADVMNAHLAGFSSAEWIQLTSLLQRMLNNADACAVNDRKSSAVFDPREAGPG